jgi:hypothetical protein
MTEGTQPDGTRDGSPTLTFRGGGWVIAVTVVVAAAFILWAISGAIWGTRPVGGGNDPAAYGFDLSDLAPEARATLVGSGNPRDFLVAYDLPAVIPGAEMLRFNADRRSKYVVTADRVAGVVVNGAARAYPLAVLNGHEVVNDVLGGVPIAVTFSPLTDSVMVFDRRIAGEERLFRVSGLLWNSNLVMYDVPADPARRAGAAASLWSQLGMRAIAGPAARGPVRLEPLPDVNIASWRMWLAAHPDTTVILPEPQTVKRYKEISYARYCLTPRVDFPVDRLVDGSAEPASADAAIAEAAAGRARTRKAAVIEARLPGGARASWSLAELAARAGQAETVELEAGGVPLVATVQRAPLAAMVRRKDGQPLVVVPQLWFAHEARGW